MAPTIFVIKSSLKSKMRMFSRAIRRSINELRKAKTLLVPVKKISASDAPIYIYHGNLYKHECQYKIPEFYGLALKRDNPRDLLLGRNGKIPISDVIVDAVQSQDVLEHVDPAFVVETLNEIYRILKPRGFFRLSVPDYRSPLLLKRTIFNHKGEALGDAGMGANAFVQDLNSELQIKHTARAGNNHLWLPTYEKISEFLESSKFASSEIKFLHYIRQMAAIAEDIPNMEVFKVKRVPPHDNRAEGLPISIVVDILKH